MGLFFALGMGPQQVWPRYLSFLSPTGEKSCEKSGKFRSREMQWNFYDCRKAPSESDWWWWFDGAGSYKY